MIIFHITEDHYLNDTKKQKNLKFDEKIWVIVRTPPWQTDGRRTDDVEADEQGESSLPLTTALLE